MIIDDDQQREPWFSIGWNRVSVVGAFLLLLLAAFYLGRVEVVRGPRLARVLYYLDPMHPEYRSSSPGIAPDCGMALVPVYADADAPDETRLPSGTVRISAQQQELIGLRTAEVERTSGSDELRMPGVVTQDDSRVSIINSAVSGLLLQTSDNSVGSHVSKGQTLAKFYSQELVALEQSFLVATERMTAAPSPQSEQTTKAAAAWLHNAGMGDRQINEIQNTRSLPENVDVISPDAGIIVSRTVSAGQNFDKGTEFYRVADLSHVWINAEVSEGDTHYFRPGMTVSVSMPGHNQTSPARVSKVLPQFDPVTRTAHVRLEAVNPGLTLRPKMLVMLALPVARHAGLSIPSDALIDSGTDQLAYVDAGGGNFQARTVRAGRQFGDRIEVLGGLEAGEKVVVAGTFLVDSARRLKRVHGSEHAAVAQYAF